MPELKSQESVAIVVHNDGMSDYEVATSLCYARHDPIATGFVEQVR